MSFYFFSIFLLTIAKTFEKPNKTIKNCWNVPCFGVFLPNGTSLFHKGRSLHTSLSISVQISAPHCHKASKQASKSLTISFMWAFPCS